MKFLALLYFHIIELGTDLVVGVIWHQVVFQLSPLLLLFLSFFLFLACGHTIDYRVSLSNFQ